MTTHVGAVTELRLAVRPDHLPRLRQGNPFAALLVGERGLEVGDEHQILKVGAELDMGGRGERWGVGD